MSTIVTRDTGLQKGLALRADVCRPVQTHNLTCRVYLSRVQSDVHNKPKLANVVPLSGDLLQ